MHLYGKPQEKRDIELLEAMGYDVLNPNTPEIKAACLAEKKRGGTGMHYFKGLVQSCDVVAFRAYPDGKIGAGVYTEITEYAKGKIVFELPWGIERRGLSVEDTRAMLRELGER